MNIRGKKSAILGAATAVSLLGLAAPAAQAGDIEFYPAFRWEMNEHPNATVLHDGSGNGLHGKIGKRITPTNQRYFHFPKTDRSEVYPQQIARVPDNDALDPGFHDFGVSVSFRWGSTKDWGSKTRHDMNLVQKGQGSPNGGMFKMKTTVPGQGQPRGHIKCLFRGEVDGQTVDSQVESYAGYRLDDGKWHTVKCVRNNNGSMMYVDGVFVDHNPRLVGSITNNWPVSIGGNTFCEDTATENNFCNYWWGDIDFVRWLGT